MPKAQHVFICALILCAALFLSPLLTFAQTVNIPDTNLRAAIAEALGKPQGAQITREEMATLTDLEAHNADISDLTGLEFAINLVEIRCNNNLISDISPLAKLMRLRVIELRQNVINDLSPLTQLISLESLIVNGNSIVDLSPVEGLINLRGLEISDNLISDLSPIAGLIKLERLWMSENPPLDISPLAGLTNLNGFHTWGTSILSDLSVFSKLPKLHVIDICGGDVSDLSDLEGLTGLRRLELAGNEISDISPLASLTGLTHLNLRHNQIVDVSPLTTLSTLTQIDLHDNEVLDFSPLDVFPESVFITRSENPGATRPAPKIEGPWLWMVVPTDGMSGSKAAASGKDFLGEVSGGSVTELKIATQGAMEGDTVGDKVWTVGELSKRGGNNINELVNTAGLGMGNIDHHVAYGSVNLDSPREQNTKMFVGSGDAVKVWLNGKLVHSNATDRDANGYQESFSVTLKQGSNTLLVAVYEGEGWWSGFFGFDGGTDYTVWTQSPPILPKPLQVADMNEDGFVNILDLIVVARDFERNKPINPRTDINGDGKINILDLVTVARSMDATVPAAPSARMANNQVSPAVIWSWIAQAQIADDGSLAFQQGITNLQRLLDSFAPKETVLRANYPNPFNPETWVPYQLAKAAKVQIHIYAASGVLVRTLDLGHQPAGTYHQRSRAAHWDGKNEIGESVASGVYFYTLTAGDFAATRKMIIRK
ncbi:T9SS type A sorting domain-containing protein [Candidatus Poribacteria bacterium]|nr:T9SS type A sorting domain-containing protein [Candidatus Poribacteria bacterium]